MTRSVVQIPGDDEVNVFKDVEVEFLRLCCTDTPYREIAGIMGKSPRTIDGYRDDLFLLLRVRSRTGLVLWCFKTGFMRPKDIHLPVYNRKPKKPKPKKKRAKKNPR